MGNETNADFDLEGFSKDGKRCRNIVNEPVEPGATATIAFANVPVAAAWINDYYGVLVEVGHRGKGRNGSAEIGHNDDGVANCRSPDEIDAENDSMSVGETLETTIDDYRFVLTREENRKPGWLVFRVNVQDVS